MAEAFDGWGLLAFGAAGVTTVMLAASNADHELHAFAYRHTRSEAWGQASYYTGYALPVAFPLVFYGVAAMADRPGLWGAAAATTQSLVTALALTGILKLATGRTFPAHGEAPDDSHRFEHPEYSREFKLFGGFAGAWAWPSGHTVGAVAIAASLTGYYHEHVWVPLVTYPIAFAVAGGMIAGEHHWVSDVVAGAIISQTIGYTVGRAFRRRAESHAMARSRDGHAHTEDTPWRVWLAPMATGSMPGVSLYGTF